MSLMLKLATFTGAATLRCAQQSVARRKASGISFSFPGKLKLMPLAFRRATLCCAQRKVAAPVKVASFNINDINKRFQNLSAWLSKTQPDVVCLQELKAEQQAFPADKLRALGYKAVWRGERSWNGVAILARN